LNKQEIFNKIWDWAIVKEMPKSISLSKVDPFNPNKNQCLYRGENNSKCFIGVLIPDDIYYPALEGASVFHDYMKEIFTKINIPTDKNMLNFLSDLQLLHDCCPQDSYHEDIKEDLIAFADRNGLTIPTE
jgi:hypothetical protein